MGTEEERREDGEGKGEGRREREKGERRKGMENEAWGRERMAKGEWTMKEVGRRRGGKEELGKFDHVFFVLY